MSYTKQEFKSGEKLYAAQLNAMDEQIAANAAKGEELSGDFFNTSKKIDFIYTADSGLTNIYNFEDPDVVVGKMVNIVNGELFDSQYVVTTGFIPITTGTTYSFPVLAGVYGWNSDAVGKVALYDANKSFIGTASGSIDDKWILTVGIDSINASFIRTSMSQTGSGNPFGYAYKTMMVVNGKEYPEEFIPFGKTVSVNPEFNGEIALAEEHVQQVKDSMPKTSVSPLYGKRVVFTGDSICAGLTDETGVRGWAQRIGKKYSMDWTNAAVSGGTITDQTVLTNSPFCIAETDFGENPDYIIIEGGANDADSIGCQKDENGTYLRDDNGDFIPNIAYGTFSITRYESAVDKSTFCGAVDALFKRVITDYAGAKIGFIIVHKMGGWDGGSYDYTSKNSVRRFYFETIITLCKKWGIPYIDLWDGCYLNPTLAAHNSGENPFFCNSDMQHLSARGYDYITPMIEKWMETL